MTDLKKLKKTFDELGVDYTLCDVIDNTTLIYISFDSQSPHNVVPRRETDFVFDSKGKFIKVK